MSLSGQQLWSFFILVHIKGESPSLEGLYICLKYSSIMKDNTFDKYILLQLYLNVNKKFKKRSFFMPNQIYSKKEYAIYPCRRGRGFIVHNTKYKFEDSHTHIDNFNEAKRLIYYAIKGSIPGSCSLRFLYSLSRITCGEFSFRAKSLADIRKEKGRKDYYYNPGAKRTLKGGNQFDKNIKRLRSDRN